MLRRARLGAFVVASVAFACGAPSAKTSCVAKGGGSPFPSETVPPKKEASPKEWMKPPWSDAVKAHVEATRASVMLPLEISRDGYRIFGSPAPDLSAVYAHARAARAEHYEVGGSVLVFDFQRIRYGTSVIYDGQQEFIKLASEELEYRRSGEEGHMNALLAFGLRPLSLVGTLLTYENTWACACAGGPPSSDVSWTTIDLKTRRAPSLLDSFEEVSLVEALLDDRCVAPLLTQPSPRPRSFDEVVSLLKKEAPPSADCLGASRAFVHFAFAGYDSERDLVSLRLGFRHEVGPGHSKTSYLGLLVPPRPPLRAALQEVTTGDGFFMSEER